MEFEKLVLRGLVLILRSLWLLLPWYRPPKLKKAIDEFEVSCSACQKRLGHQTGVKTNGSL